MTSALGKTRFGRVQQGSEVLGEECEVVRYYAPFQLERPRREEGRAVHRRGGGDGIERLLTVAEPWEDRRGEHARVDACRCQAPDRFEASLRWRGVRLGGGRQPRRERADAPARLHVEASG